MSNIWKKGCGKTSTIILKASHQKHRSCQLYSNEKEWLATNPAGKLPTNQKTEGYKEEEILLVHMILAHYIGITVVQRTTQ
jgi:hypothetical protein